MGIGDSEIVVGFANASAAAGGNFDVEVFVWSRRGGIHGPGLPFAGETSEALGVSDSGEVDDPAVAGNRVCSGVARPLAPEQARSVFGDELDLVGEVVAGLGDTDLVPPTGCAGWRVADPVVHLRLDAEAALASLASTTGAPADRNAVSYWSEWPGGGRAGFAAVRSTWAMAAAYLRGGGCSRTSRTCGPPPRRPDARRWWARGPSRATCSRSRTSWRCGSSRSPSTIATSSSTSRGGRDRCPGPATCWARPWRAARCGAALRVGPGGERVRRGATGRGAGSGRACLSEQRGALGLVRVTGVRYNRAVSAAPTSGSGPPAGPDPNLRVFSYAVAEKATTYLAVVDALVEAKERFQLQLRPAELVRHLHGDGLGLDEVTDALESLSGWGNVSRFYDPAAPETLDQFYAKRFLYQLTEAGMAAHEGVRAVRRIGLDSGRLSGVLLPAIAEGLRALRAEADATGPDPARLYAVFVNLFSSFKELADNAARYMDALSVELATITTDDESFLAYKRAVFAYLNEFVARLSERVPEIVSVLAELDERIHDLVELAARADEAPVLEGEDDGVRRSFLGRWSGVRAWFVATIPEEPSIADSLRSAMLDALNRILAALERLHERHLRRVSREADFTQLARWFAVAEGDGAANLWDAAFGLWAPRHFADFAGDEEVERGRSFWDAAPAEVAPRLRASGSRASPGRPARAVSYREAKLARLAVVREAHRQAELALARLADRTPLRLSDLGRLDTEEFAALLSVVDAALASLPDRDGVRRASTALVAVGLRSLGPGSAAEIVTPVGRWRCEDCVLEIEVGAQGRSFARLDAERAG